MGEEERGGEEGGKWKTLVLSNKVGTNDFLLVGRTQNLPKTLNRTNQLEVFWGHPLAFYWESELTYKLIHLNCIGRKWGMESCWLFTTAVCWWSLLRRTCGTTLWCWPVSVVSSPKRTRPLSRTTFRYPNATFKVKRERWTCHQLDNHPIKIFQMKFA